MSRTVNECIDFSTSVDELLKDDDEQQENIEQGYEKEENLPQTTVKNDTNLKPILQTCQTQKNKNKKVQLPDNDDTDEDNEEDVNENKELKQNRKNILKNIPLNNMFNKTTNHSTVWYLRLDRSHVYYILMFAIIFIILTLPSFVSFYKTFVPFCFNDTGASYTSTGSIVFGCIASLVHAILTLK